MGDVSDFRIPDYSPSPNSSESVTVSADRESPADIHAESVLLGSVLLDVNAYSEIAENLTPSDFFLSSHVTIFRAMGDLIDSGSGVDIVTLSSELARRKEIESVGGVAFIAALTESLPRRPVIGDYVRIVKAKGQLRRMIHLFSVAIERAQDQADGPLEILEDAEGALLEIAQEANVGKLRTIADSVEMVGGVDSYMAPIINPVERTGLLTGFTEYDAMTGGLQKGELTVIAARPSMGKTGLLANILENVCIGTENVAAFFSLEMSRSAMERRFLASRARVDVRRALSGLFLSQLEKDKLQEALAALVESRLYIDDTANLTPTQMRAKARRLKQRQGRLDLVSIDYAQLVSGGGRKYSSRQEEVSAVSRSLKQMSKELDCPVIALAQLNRGNEARQDKRPILSDLRESGQIEQDADLVAFIHREAYYDPQNEEKRGLADLIIAKQRNGGTGTIPLAFIAEIVRFDNLVRR